jgi:hypothetical protein
MKRPMKRNKTKRWLGDPTGQAVAGRSAWTPAGHNHPANFEEYCLVKLSTCNQNLTTKSF